MICDLPLAFALFVDTLAKDTLGAIRGRHAHSRKNTRSDPPLRPGPLPNLFFLISSEPREFCFFSFLRLSVCGPSWATLFFSPSHDRNRPCPPRVFSLRHKHKNPARGLGDEPTPFPCKRTTVHDIIRSGAFSGIHPFGRSRRTDSMRHLSRPPTQEQVPPTSASAAGRPCPSRPWLHPDGRSRRRAAPARSLDRRQTHGASPLCRVSPCSVFVGRRPPHTHHRRPAATDRAGAS